MKVLVSERSVSSDAHPQGYSELHGRGRQGWTTIFIRNPDLEESGQVPPGGNALLWGNAQLSRGFEVGQCVVDGQGQVAISGQRYQPPSHVAKVAYHAGAEAVIVVEKQRIVVRKNMKQDGIVFSVPWSVVLGEESWGLGKIDGYSWELAAIIRDQGLVLLDRHEGRLYLVNGKTGEVQKTPKYVGYLDSAEQDSVLTMGRGGVVEYSLQNGNWRERKYKTRYPDGREAREALDVDSDYGGYTVTIVENRVWVVEDEIRSYVLRISRDTASVTVVEIPYENLVGVTQNYLLFEEYGVVIGFSKNDCTPAFCCDAGEHPSVFTNDADDGFFTESADDHGDRRAWDPSGTKNQEYPQIPVYRFSDFFSHLTLPKGYSRRRVDSKELSPRTHSRARSYSLGLLELHGMKAEPAKRLLRDTIDKNETDLLLIMHGKGSGSLRNMVHQALARCGAQVLHIGGQTLERPGSAFVLLRLKSSEKEVSNTWTSDHVEGRPVRPGGQYSHLKHSGPGTKSTKRASRTTPSGTSAGRSSQGNGCGEIALFAVVILVVVFFGICVGAVQ